MRNPGPSSLSRRTADAASGDAAASGLWKDPQNIVQSPKKSVVTAGGGGGGGGGGAGSSGGPLGGGLLKVKMFRKVGGPGSYWTFCTPSHRTIHNQCCGSKYIEFGSGTCTLTYFGSGSRVILISYNDKFKKYLEKINFLFFYFFLFFLTIRK